MVSLGFLSLTAVQYVPKSVTLYLVSSLFSLILGDGFNLSDYNPSRTHRVFF